MRLGNAEAQSRTVSAVYAPRNISDISLPLIIRINLSHTLQARLWTVNPFWFTLFPTLDPIPKAITEFLRFNRGPGTVSTGFPQCS